MKTIAPREELEALEQERAFVDLSSYRKVRLGGSDARAWLHDLVTTDVASLEPGHARRSLLLSAAGHIRADFSVACEDDGFLLLQPSDQPDHVGLLLSRYTLSSDVLLHDATNELALFGVPGHAATLVGRPGLAPSVLGSGVDLIARAGKAAWRIEDMFVKHDLVEVGEEAADVWRVRRGVARMGRDFNARSLPAEAGLEDAIDVTKGCFLGQESVARVRNLGHPPRRLLHLHADVEIEPGMPVFAGSVEVGRITSAASAADEGWVAIASVRWAFSEMVLAAEGHTRLTPVRTPVPASVGRRD